MINDLKILTADNESEKDVTDVLTLAFASDPMARWGSKPGQYLVNFPILAGLFGSKAFENGTAFYSSDLGGAALWLGPGIEPDVASLIAHAGSNAPPEIKPDLYAVFGKMGECHPKEPHWYLPLIGVDPVKQNMGIGSALLKKGLELCDRDRLPAYLESSNPRNIPLYIRHGFKVIDEIRSGTSPVMAAMLRPAA